MTHERFVSNFGSGFMVMIAAAFMALATLCDATWMGIAGIFLGGVSIVVEAIWKRARALKRGGQ